MQNTTWSTSCRKKSEKAWLIFSRQKECRCVGSSGVHKTTAAFNQIGDANQRIKSGDVAGGRLRNQY